MLCFDLLFKDLKEGEIDVTMVRGKLKTFDLSAHTPDCFSTNITGGCSSIPTSPRWVIRVHLCESSLISPQFTKCFVCL